MNYDGYTPNYRSYRSFDSDFNSVELMVSPSRALKRSMFSDLPLGGQYLQGYSPSKCRSSLYGFDYEEADQHSASDNGPTPDLSSYYGSCMFGSLSPNKQVQCSSSSTSTSSGTSPSSSDHNTTSPNQPTMSKSLQHNHPYQSNHQSSSSLDRMKRRVEFVTSEYRSGCRGVSWNRRMKAWLAFWTEGKVRRSKTFNAKLLGFEQAKSHAIEFLKEKKAQLQIRDTDSPESSFFISGNASDDEMPEPIADMDL